MNAAGTTIAYGAEELRKIAREQAAAIAAGEDHYVYKTSIACGGDAYSFDLPECFEVTKLCPGEAGPLANIFREKMSAEGKVLETWKWLGSTCLPNEVPGAQKVPTMAMIRQAMHETKWAEATVGFQPKGNTTLVTLPNFYRAAWSAAGYGPGEVDRVDPATMYGYRVDIRPKLVGLTYVFGDGTSQGPTTSLGGTYPDGDIRHTYATAGRYDVHVRVEWGADFRINGGGWIQIPDTVTVDEPATTITVRTATNRLVTR